MNKNIIYILLSILFILLILILFLPNHNYVKFPHYETKNVSLAFEIPIDSNSFLKEQREDDFDYPGDFQIYNGVLYLVSTNEKKIIQIDLDTKKITNCDKMNLRLSQEKSFDSQVLQPHFFRMNSNLIVIGYSNELLIFSRDQTYKHKIDINKNISYITVDESKIYVWLFGMIITIDLNDNYHQTAKQYSNIHFDPYVTTRDNEIMAFQDSMYKYKDNKLIAIPFKYKPPNILPETDDDKLTLCCITNKYYVWCPRAVGSKLLLIDKENGDQRIIDLGENLMKDNLYYYDFTNRGLEVRNAGSILYFMVMRNINGKKEILIYELNTT